MDKFLKVILIILTVVIVFMAFIFTIDVFLSHGIIFAEKKVNVVELVVDVLFAIPTLIVACAAFCVSKKTDERDKEDKERQTSSVVSLSKSKTLSPIYLKPETSNCNGENILCFSVENSGEAMLQKIKLTSDDYKEFNFISHLSIPKGGIKSVYLNLPDYFRNENKIRITFISCYGKETHGTFVLKQIKNKSNCGYHEKCKKRGNCKFSIKYYHYNAFDKDGD